MALRPFPKGPEIVLEDGWRLAVSEAGRSAQGLKASVTLSNGTGRTRQTIALGSEKQQQTLLTTFVEFSGLAMDRLQGALAELSEAVEGALRLLEAHQPDTDKAAKPEAGSALTFDTIDPWPTPVDGAQLLTALADTFETYLVLPAGGKEALALWTAHAMRIPMRQAPLPRVWVPSRPRSGLAKPACWKPCPCSRHGCFYRPIAHRRRYSGRSNSGNPPS